MTVKLERLITDKENFDVDMVILAVGFRPNTALADGKIELFRNGAFPCRQKQETSIPGVYAVGDCATVLTTLVKTLATSRLLQTLFVLVSLVHTTLVDMNWKESVFKDQTVSNLRSCMVSTGLTLKKRKLLVTMQLETGFNDLQNQNL